MVNGGGGVLQAIIAPPTLVPVVFVVLAKSRVHVCFELTFLFTHNTHSISEMLRTQDDELMINVPYGR